MAEASRPSKRVFKFVKIPADISEPVEELEQELVPDKEVECLLDRLKVNSRSARLTGPSMPRPRLVHHPSRVNPPQEHFRASAPRKSAAQLKAQRAELMKSLPVGQEIDEKLLEAATTLQMVRPLPPLARCAPPANRFTPFLALLSPRWRTSRCCPTPRAMAS